MKRNVEFWSLHVFLSKCNVSTCYRQTCWWLCKRLSVCVLDMLTYTSCDMQLCQDMLVQYLVSTFCLFCCTDHLVHVHYTTYSTYISTPHQETHVMWLVPSLPFHCTAYCLSFDSNTHSRDLHACMTDKCCQARSRRVAPYKREAAALHASLQQNGVVQNGLHNGIDGTWDGSTAV